MNEQNKGIQVKKEETPRIKEGASTTAAVPSNGWRRLLSKRWAFPAMYMAAAAIILTFVWVYQDMGKTTPTADKTVAETAKTDANATTQLDASGNTLPVIANAETMQWPVKDRSQVVTSLPFYDSKASNEVKQAAMVQFGDTFTPHTGIDLARQDNQTFDVLAALSGTVTVVEKNPIVGNLVEITHNNGLITVYQSLSDVKVTQGATVKKGDLIATAGVNELEKDDGVHVHFEVRQGKDGPVINPETLITDAGK
jgi:stage II sporulation protein Q